MALSNASAAKRALYDGLLEELAPEVGVWHSQPNIDRPGNENVYVAPVDRPVTFAQEWRGLGAGATRDEGIDIPVSIEVFKPGTDEFAAEDRAWEIAGALATFLATRPFEPEIYEAHPDQGELATEPFSDGRLARLTLVVHCQGRVAGI